MSPFIGNVSGISPVTLELIDHALSGAWRELESKNNPAEARNSVIPVDRTAAEAKSRVPSSSAGRSGTVAE
jgi:hypothetical protein